MLHNSAEYEPLEGSGMAPHKQRAVMFGGGAALLVLGLFLFSGSSSGGGVMSVHQQADVLKPLTQADVTSSSESATNLAAAAAPAADTFTNVQYQLVYNTLSFAIASMGCATVFFFFQFSLVDKQFRTALVITALVTLIAFYHYIRIFNSFTDAYVDVNDVVSATGVPFNDAYRYVDWLLTVPLLLMELILVMSLSAEETRSQCLKLGVSAALMITFGYPGEISDVNTTRWIFWAISMVFFIYIVYTLFVGLSESVSNQPERARGLVDTARWVTVISWCTYPVVYVLPMLGVSGAAAKVAIQIGYSIADVIAKPIIGLMVWQIALRKSKGSDDFSG